MDAKDLFKKLVNDAKERKTGVLHSPIMYYGSQHISDFEIKKKHVGKFSYITNEFIDKLSDQDLEMELVSFIYKCFQQR